MRSQRLLALLTVLVVPLAAACGPNQNEASQWSAPSSAAVPAAPTAPAAGAAPATSASPSASVSASASASASPTPSPSKTAVALASGPRDPFLRPFTSDSVWNTAIGSKAKFSKVTIGSRGIGVDVERIVRAKKSDPVVASYDAGNFAGVRCSGTKPQQQATWHAGLDKIQVPASLTIPDARTDPGHYWTPNSKLTILGADGHTLRSFLPACRKAGGPLYGYAFPAQDVRGDGLCCGHGASSLSGMGGVLRVGELTGAAPIQHVLALNLWGQYLHYDAATGSGHVWPAAMNDGAAPSTYHGTNPALQMGSLLALPPSVTEASLHLQTKAGRKLFWTMQNYGALVVEDTGQNTQELDMDVNAETELKKTLTGGRELSQYGPLSADFTAIMKQVRAVSNNTAKSVGGGGKPLVAKQAGLR